MADDERAAPPPRDYLVRAMPGSYELREELEAGDGRLATLRGHFARFNEWTTIDSKVEGRFRERVAPGAFRKTFVENRSRMRSLFNHGKDPQIGDKPLGPIEELREDEEGGYYEVALLDTSYNRDLLPGLRAGVYGSSFRFSVVREDVSRAKRDAKGNYPADNPDGLPERTIREARLFEFGPVTFPAYAGATASVRSMTDEYLFTDLTDNPDRLRELVTYVEPLAPSADAGAEPHLESERRDQADAPPTTTEKEMPPVADDLFTIDEKKARIGELKASLARTNQEYPGTLPAAEQVRWDAEKDELLRLQADVKAREEREEFLGGQVEEPTRTTPGAYTPPAIIRRASEADLYDLDSVINRSRTIPEQRQLLRDNAMRVAEQLRVPGSRYDQERSRERLQDLLDFTDSEDKEIARLVIGTNSPAYRAAFNRYIKSGGSERGTALAVGVDGTGGYSVPVSLDPTVLHIGAHTAVNPYRASCRVVTIAGTDTWQAITATAITAAYALEAAAADEQGPTFARPEYIAKRAHAAVTLSYEMLQDRADIASELSDLIGEAKDTLEENQFTVGVGTTVYPQGIGLKDAFTRVDSVTNDTTAVADVLAVEAALPIRHRMNAAWYLTRKAIRAIQAWETTGGQLFNGTGYPAVGNPVNRPGGNTGLTLLGYPVWETPSMPWTPTTDDTTWGVLMDPRNYVILDRVGLSVKVIPDAFDATTGFPTGQSFVYAFWRNTARVLNVDGGRQGAVQ